MEQGRTPFRIAAILIATMREPVVIVCAAISVGLFSSLALVPIFGVLIGVFTPTPLVYLYCRGGRVFGLTGIALGALAVGLLSGVLFRHFGLLFFLEYALLALVMGETLGRSATPEKAVGYPAGTILSVGLILLVIMSMASDQNPWRYGRSVIEGQIRASVQTYDAILAQGGPPDGSPVQGDPKPGGAEAPTIRPEETAPPSDGPLPASSADEAMSRFVEFMVGIFPGLMVVGTFLVAWANFMVGRSLLLQRGLLHPALADLTRWRVPERLVWIVIASGFGLVFLRDWPRLVLVNILMILGLFYFFQGLAIVSFWMKKKALPPFMRVTAYALIALQQYLILMIAALGLFDMWIDFRKIHKAGAGPEA
ncbi:MAG: YybS family protein [Proteobacteria bacterium]|nr:YybS family protein [Pseudomonadota bacterium]